MLLVRPVGVVPSQMVGVSASDKLPLHDKVQKFSSGNGSTGWSRKKGRKRVVCVFVVQSIKSFGTTILPPFYDPYTGQSALAGTPVKN